MPIDDFLNFLKKSVPTGARNIELQLSTDSDYGYSGELEYAYPQLDISWEEKEIDPDFDKRMKRYEKKLIKWEKEQCQK